jgi:hypothetical protein
MSSISSCDSYHLSVEDDPYMRRLNELESGSDSDQDNVDRTRNMKTELELISLYSKCKKKVYTLAHAHQKKYTDGLLLVSLLSSGSFVILPLERVYVSLFGIFTMICIFLKYYFNYENHYHNVSLRYGRLQLDIDNFLSKLVYIFSNVERQSTFYEKLREIETKLGFFKEEETVALPSAISTNFPTTINMNIFANLHNVELNQKALMLQYKNVQNEMERADKERRKILSKKKKEIKEEINNPDYSIIKKPLEQELKGGL